MTNFGNPEGLKAARLLMIISSLSPLFILWGIRGGAIISDYYFCIFCFAMVALPNLFLLKRIESARQHKEYRQITIGSAEDHREHLLVYLFSMLLPFYTADLTSWRELCAVIAALAFIVFLFAHLNLHYMNLYFALRGYRIFTIFPPHDCNKYSGKTSSIIITKRISLPLGERLPLLRLSNTVFMEVE